MFFNFGGFGCGVEGDGEVAILGPFGCQNFETEHVGLFNSKVIDFQLALVSIQSWAGGLSFWESDDPGVFVLVGLGFGSGMGCVDLDWGVGGGTRSGSGVGGGGLLSAYLVPDVFRIRLSVQGTFCIVCPVQSWVRDGEIGEGKFFGPWGETQRARGVQVLVILGWGL